MENIKLAMVIIEASSVPRRLLASSGWPTKTSHGWRSRELSASVEPDHRNNEDRARDRHHRRQEPEARAQIIPERPQVPDVPPEHAAPREDADRVSSEEHQARASGTGR